MNKNEKFLKYLKENYDCNNISEYVNKVIDDLDNGVIVDIVSIMEFIENNYGKACLNNFMFKFKGVLFKRNSKRAEKIENALIDSYVDLKCIIRSEEELFFDDYSGCVCDDFVENCVKRR